MKKMMSIIKLNIKIVFCKFWAVLGIVFTVISMLLCFFSLGKIFPIPICAVD